MTGGWSGNAGGRSREVLAFLDALQGVRPGAVTACRGWTVHEIVAHLTGGCVAVSEQVEAYAAGEPVPPFGSWEERDDVLRRVDDAVLRRRLDEAEVRMTAGLRALAERDPGLVIPGGGWGFPLPHLVTHFRQEFALHRWDLVGDDPVGEDLLSAPAFVEHSVNWIGDWLLQRGMRSDPGVGTDFEARLRGMAEDDVVLRVRAGRGTLSLEPAAGATEVVLTDPVAGLLFIWGRHPGDSRRLVSRMPVAHLVRMTSLLSGF